MNAGLLASSGGGPAGTEGGGSAPARRLPREPLPFAPLGGASAPTTLLTYGGPVSNDPVTLGFKQSIGAADALRTGTYSKTLTFTLSTTAP